MSKKINDKEWFHHDYGTRNKTKLAVLIVNEGTKGYGLFWIIVEMLYEARDKCLELHDHSYIAIKKETGGEVDEIKEFIERCINHYKVFKVHKKCFFTTERVLENEKVRKKESEKAREKGLKSGESRRNKRTVVQQEFNSSSTVAEPNGTKESREKESKEEKSKGDESNPTLLFENKIEDGVTKMKIEDCFTVSRNDPKWMKDSGATDELLADFNKLLSSRGEYWKNPADYKKHFSNWKRLGKKFDPPQQDGQVINLADQLRQQKTNSILNG